MFSEFSQHLTPENLRSIKIIQLTMGLGLVFSGALVLLLYYKIPDSAKHDTSDMLFLIRILTYTHVGLAIVMYSVSKIVFKKMVRWDRLSNLSYDGVSGTGNPEMTSSEKFLLMIRSAIIVRLAMYEGVAFFGLIICLLGTANGILQVNPGYWVNSFSTIATLWLIFKTYPSRDVIQRICRDANLLT